MSFEKWMTVWCACFSRLLPFGDALKLRVDVTSIPIATMVLPFAVVDGTLGARSGVGPVVGVGGERVPAT